MLEQMVFFSSKCGKFTNYLSFLSFQFFCQSLIVTTISLNQQIGNASDFVFMKERIMILNAGNIYLLHTGGDIQVVDRRKFRYRTNIQQISVFQFSI